MATTQQNTEDIEFLLSIDSFDPRLIRGISDDMDVLMNRQYNPEVGYVFIDGRDAMYNDRNPTYRVRCYKTGYDWATDTRGESALDKFEVTRQTLR